MTITLKHHEYIKKLEDRVAELESKDNPKIHLPRWKELCEREWHLNVLPNWNKLDGNIYLDYTCKLGETLYGYEFNIRYIKPASYTKGKYFFLPSEFEPAEERIVDWGGIVSGYYDSNYELSEATSVSLNEFLESRRS